VYNILYMSTFSKYDVLELLAKKMPFYAATQWLKASNKNLGGATPSECMKEGKSHEVHEVLKKHLEGK
jgi:hypothetical protein